MEDELNRTFRRLSPKVYSEPRFDLGPVTVTPTARMVLNESDVQAALRRHERGDWGEADPEEREQNELALGLLGEGSADLDDVVVWSTYSLESGVEYWVITEIKHPSTTVRIYDYLP